jgi:hypothetical protein
MNADTIDNSTFSVVSLSTPFRDAYDETLYTTSTSVFSLKHLLDHQQT